MDSYTFEFNNTNSPSGNEHQSIREIYLFSGHKNSDKTLHC